MCPLTEPSDRLSNVLNSVLVCANLNWLGSVALTLTESRSCLAVVYSSTHITVKGSGPGTPCTVTLCCWAARLSSVLNSWQEKREQSSLFLFHTPNLKTYNVLLNKRAHSLYLFRDIKQLLTVYINKMIQSYCVYSQCILFFILFFILWSRHQWREKMWPKRKNILITVHKYNTVSATDFKHFLPMMFIIMSIYR